MSQKRVIITVPDELSTTEIVDYVRAVADQIDQTYLSGHVAVDHHWTSEGRLS